MCLLQKYETSFHRDMFDPCRDEHKDFKEEMERLRTLRGKNRVRKGWKDGVKPEKIVVPRYEQEHDHPSLEEKPP